MGRASIAALLLIVALPRPASANALTLARALELALDRNPQLLAIRQEVRVASGRLVEARYWNPFNPQIEGGAGQRRFDGGGNDVQPFASASLEVEVAGQRGKRIEEAERNLARVGAEVADAERRLVAEVKEAFYRGLYLGRRLFLFREIEDLNRRLRDASSERFRSGEVAKTEANLAIVRHSQSRKDTLSAARDHANALRELERLLGLEPSATVHLDGDLAVADLEVDPETLVRTALEVRPDLKARGAEIERLEAETALVKRLIVPNPTVSVLYDEEVEGEGNRDRIIGGAIRIPIPVFDRNQAELTALAGRRARAAHERDATELAVETEVRNAYRAYEAAVEAVRVFETEAVDRVAESFRFIETSYREGKIDLLQLVVVQNDLVGAQLSYLDSLWDYWAAHVALERAVGRPLEGGSGS
jgi:cobalt-zinc-cadmium efflux system outer membrane protein